jgi:hypothetical protein
MHYDDERKQAAKIIGPKLGWFTTRGLPKVVRVVVWRR